MCVKRSLEENQLTTLYLEDLLIQDPGAKHGNAIGVDGSVVTPGQRLDDLLLTVYNDSDRLLLHTDSHTVPPGRGHNKEKWAIKEGWAGRVNPLLSYFQEFRHLMELSCNTSDKAPVILQVCNHHKKWSMMSYIYSQ